jgi:hypothetical protein
MIRLTNLIDIEANVELVVKDNTTGEFCEFAQKRFDGAKKISDDAKKKGGPALLTYEHFVVKLPYYEVAKDGKFVPLEASRELKQILNEVGNLLGGSLNMEQTQFQRIIGRLEVLGELIIKWNECNKR